MHNIRIKKGKGNSKILKFTVILLVIFTSTILASYFFNNKLNYKKNVVIGASNNFVDKKPDDGNKIIIEKPIKTDNTVDKQLGVKEAFLTFDDGPTWSITPKILDVLKSYDVKATFFVIGNRAKENSDIVKREINEGHAVANHTYSHNYKHIYSSPENFVQDVKDADETLKNIIQGYSSKLIRFPGGSFGKEAYQKAVTEAGYHYIDWNAINGDAEGKKNLKPEDLIEKLKQTAKHPNHLVILMHDAPLKEATVQALPQIIEYLKAQGYTFKTLE